MTKPMGHLEYKTKKFLVKYGRATALALSFACVSGATYNFYQDFQRAHACDLKEQAARRDHVDPAVYTAGMDCDTSFSHIAQTGFAPLAAGFAFLATAFHRGRKKIGEKKDEWHNHIQHHEQKNTI